MRNWVLFLFNFLFPFLLFVTVEVIIPELLYRLGKVKKKNNEY